MKSVNKEDKKCPVSDFSLQMKKLVIKESTSMNLAEFFKVFGDSTRIRIINVLSLKEACVCDIASTLGMTHSAISHQLKILNDAKLVKKRREGKQIYYSLKDNHVNSIYKMGLEHIKEK